MLNGEQNCAICVQKKRKRNMNVMFKNFRDFSFQTFEEVYRISIMYYKIFLIHVFDIHVPFQMEKEKAQTH